MREHENMTQALAAGAFAFFIELHIQFSFQHGRSTPDAIKCISSLLRLKKV